MRTRAIRVVVFAAAILVALALAEVALRVSGFGESTVFLHAGILRHHPVLGWEKQPSARAVYEFEGSPVVETSNSVGLRGPLVPKEKAQGEFRVLALGDSFCEGYLVNDGEVFSAALERDWKGPRKLAVLNAGVAGYSTDQELLYFRETGAGYSPDVTVVFFFDNDVWFNTQLDEYRSKKPRFALAEGTLRLEGVPVPPPPTSAASAPSGAKAWLWQHFRVAQVIADGAAMLPWLKRGSAVPQSGLEAEQEPTPREPRDLPGEFKVYRRDQPDDIADAWRVTEAILGELKRETEAAGGRLAVFYVPTVAAIYPQAWEATKRRWGLNDEQWNIGQVEPILAEVCERQGVDFIPAIDPLRNAAKRLESRSGRLYFMQDGHWNAAGHAAAAGMLKAYLARTIN